VHEDVALEKSFRFLRPGGYIGVVEGAWHPDFKQLETELMDEMARFGTLENPFSTRYLDSVLERHGFADINRYVAVNGFFTKHQLSTPLAEFSAPLEGSNNITARKPAVGHPRCTDLHFSTDAGIKLLEAVFDNSTRLATLKIELQNTGETILDNNPELFAHITVALRRGPPGGDDSLECQERNRLPEALAPGKTVQIQIQFTLPAGAPLDNWELDLVAEGLFWFSSRGIQVCPVNCTEYFLKNKK